MSSKYKIDGVSIAIVVFVIVAALPLIYAGVSFDRQQVNLSDNDEASAASNARIEDLGAPLLLQSLAANGSNVYVVWVNHTDSGTTCTTATCDIIFLKSSDNGTTFSDPIILGTSASRTPHPTIAVGSAGNLFIVWQSGTDILLRASSNSGSSFTSEKDIGDIIGDIPGTFDTAQPQLLANSTGSNVYVAWTDQNNYQLVTSADNFATFTSQVDMGQVSGNDQNANTIRLAANQTHIFLVFKNNTEIVFSYSGQNGTVGTFTNQSLGILVDTAGAFEPEKNHAFPTIAANSTGSEIYIVYKNHTDLVFKRSDDGTNFTPTGFRGGVLETVNTAGTSSPEIAIGLGGNVYIVWETDTGITPPDAVNFTKSADEGLTFSVNKTFTGTDLKFPRIATSNGLVYLVWLDNLSKDRVSFVTSSNNGTSFGTTAFLESTETHDINPQVAAVNDKVYFVWESHPTSATTVNGEINFTSATGKPITITYNASDGNNFRIGEIAEITIQDTSQTTSIDVPITSPTGGGDITVTLDETGTDTGIFIGTFSFRENTGSSSDTILNVTAGDTITATHDSVTGDIGIFSRTVAWDASADIYFASSEAHLTVTDENTNTDSSTHQNVTVTITGKNTGDSKTLLLNETGTDTGIFGGITREQNNLLIVNATVGEFPIGRTATITASDATVDVTSTTDTTGISDLTLDSIGGGQFSGKLTLGSATSGRTIQVSACDTLTINPGTSLEKRFIGPCTNSSLNFITVDLHLSGAPLSDTITASYKGATDVASISNADGSAGGGGGGLVRPSLVLDILAGASSVFGSGGGGSSPVLSLKVLRESSFIAMPDEIEQAIINFGPFIPLEPFDVNAEQFEEFDFPLSIDNDGYAISGYSNTLVTKTLNTGEATKIRTVFYMPFELEHVAFYTNIRKGDSLDDSDTFLRFYQSKPDLNQIKDENGFFEYINLTIEKNGLKRIATYDIKFLKPMPKSDIVLRMWDEKLHSTTVLIFDAIEVVGPSIEPVEEPAPEDLEIPEPGTTVPETSELRIEESSTAVPDWIKTSAKWWNNEQISDTGFARGIEYLIENNILTVPQTETFEQEQVQVIPGWIKNTAGWWGDGLLPDQDFVNGIQWLIKNGIIKIQINS